MDPEITRALHSVPDDELLRRLGELVSQSRRVEADLVLHLGEVDERRLYARQAFPSMFAYCTEHLHLSEAEAYRRITVARAARRHPLLLAMLRDGRLHLSAVALLAPLLTPDNRAALLERATHLSKRQIEQLVAELSPRPDVPSVMRRLPQRLLESTSGDLSRGLDGASAGQLVPGRVEESPALTEAGAPLAAAALPSPPRAPLPVAAEPLASPVAIPARRSPSPPAVVEALSPARYKVQFTASAELHDKLERLTALMRSEVPDGDLAAVIERAVTEKLARLEARRLGKTAAPRKTLADTDTTKASRHVPAAVRRAVSQRDGERCRFVDQEGRRCSERHRLELHHRHPFGMGGDHSPDNLSLLCPQHNRYLAERDYGKAAIRQHLSGRQDPTVASGTPEPAGAGAGMGAKSARPRGTELHQADMRDAGASRVRWNEESPRPLARSRERRATATRGPDRIVRSEGRAASRTIRATTAAS